MLALTIRIILLIALAVGVVYLLQKVLNRSDFIKCGRCNGKGFWLDARGKETCNKCKGTGELPRVRGEILEAISKIPCHD